jgi:hypothetical protein
MSEWRSGLIGPRSDDDPGLGPFLHPERIAGAITATRRSRRWRRRTAFVLECAAGLVVLAAIAALVAP